MLVMFIATEQLCVRRVCVCTCITSVCRVCARVCIVSVCRVCMRALRESMCVCAH